MATVRGHNHNYLLLTITVCMASLVSVGKRDNVKCCCVKTKRTKNVSGIHENFSDLREENILV